MGFLADLPRRKSKGPAVEVDVKRLRNAQAITVLANIRDMCPSTPSVSLPLFKTVTTEFCESSCAEASATGSWKIPTQILKRCLVP